MLLCKLWHQDLVFLRILLLALLCELLLQNLLDDLFFPSLDFLLLLVVLFFLEQLLLRLDEFLLCLDTLRLPQGLFALAFRTFGVPLAEL